MIAVFLLPLYLLVNIYAARRGLTWLCACHAVFARKGVRLSFYAAYALIASSPVIGFVLPDGTGGRMFTILGHFWLGVLLYILFFLILAECVAFALRRWGILSQKRFGRRALAWAGAVVVLCVTAVSWYGVVHAQQIKSHYCTVVIEKSADMEELNIALIADLHLGYGVGARQLARVVETANAFDPDLTLIAGDILNNAYETLDDPEEIGRLFGMLNAKYGVYACYGNHDVPEKTLAGFTFSQTKIKENDPRLTELLENAGVRVLQDTSVLIDGRFYLIGRRDRRRPGNAENSRLSPAELTAGLDLSKPVLMIDHEPVGLEEIAAAGVDLDLSGHTHAGQVFPGNLIGCLFNENNWGVKKIGAMTSVVTSGAGYFGPSMRTFTDSEVMLIRVRFGEPSVR